MLFNIIFLGSVILNFQMISMNLTTKFQKSFYLFIFNEKLYIYKCLKNRDYGLPSFIP